MLNFASQLEEYLFGPTLKKEKKEEIKKKKA